MIHTIDEVTGVVDPIPFFDDWEEQAKEVNRRIQCLEAGNGKFLPAKKGSLAFLVSILKEQKVKQS